jgi:hypothetical protein
MTKTSSPPCCCVVCSSRARVCLHDAATTYISYIIVFFVPPDPILRVNIRACAAQRTCCAPLHDCERTDRPSPPGLTPRVRAQVPPGTFAAYFYLLLVPVVGFCSCKARDRPGKRLVCPSLVHARFAGGRDHGRSASVRINDAMCRVSIPNSVCNPDWHMLHTGNERKAVIHVV